MLIYFSSFKTCFAPVAQLDRVLDYESRGQGFESLLARHVGAKFALLRLIFCLRLKISHPPAPFLALLRYPALVAADKPPCQSPTTTPTNPRCIPHRGRSDMLPLSAKSHARLTCSVTNGLATVCCRYQPFAGVRLVKNFEWSSFSLSLDTSPQASYRLRRLFF